MRFLSSFYYFFGGSSIWPRSAGMTNCETFGPANGTCGNLPGYTQLLKRRCVQWPRNTPPRYLRAWRWTDHSRQHLQRLAARKPMSFLYGPSIKRKSAPSSVLSYTFGFWFIDPLWDWLSGGGRSWLYVLGRSGGALGGSFLKGVTGLVTVVLTSTFNPEKVYQLIHAYFFPVFHRRGLSISLDTVCCTDRNIQFYLFRHCFSTQDVRSVSFYQDLAARWWKAVISFP